jgi:hypothetical protein
LASSLPEHSGSQANGTWSVTAIVTVAGTGPISITPYALCAK